MRPGAVPRQAWIQENVEHSMQRTQLSLEEGAEADAPRHGERRLGNVFAESPGQRSEGALRGRLPDRGPIEMAEVPSIEELADELSPGGDRGSRERSPESTAERPGN